MENEKKDINATNIDDFDINKIRIESLLTLFLTHTAALIQKRVRYFQRDLRSLCCEIFLPCVIVVVGLGLMSISFVSDPKNLLLSVTNFPWSSTNVSWAGDPNASGLMSLFD